VPISAGSNMRMALSGVLTAWAGSMGYPRGNCYPSRKRPYATSKLLNGGRLNRVEYHYRRRWRIAATHFSSASISSLSSVGSGIAARAAAA
jgi:hypothetical protein